MMGHFADQWFRRRTLRLAAPALMAAASIGAAGCGSDAATTDEEATAEQAATADPATSDRATRDEPAADAATDRMAALALEARRLQEETADAGRGLIEEPGERDEARARLRELAGEARELGTELRREAGDAPEARSVRKAVERVERGAEQLLTFTRSDRETLLITAREQLRAADQELDGVADRLDVRLDDDARRDLEALRREVRELPAPRG